MKIKTLLLFILMALPAGLRAGETVVVGLTGTVEARLTREGEWVPAVKDMEIAEGGGIRTGERSRALVQLPNKSKVWMKEKTALEIEQRKTLSSRLALIFGNIKVRVPHLMRKEKFEMRTPTAICAVRGTEFVIDAPEGGKLDLQVLFGEVNFKFQVPQPKGRSEFNIPQGQGITSRDDGKPSAPVLLTARQEQAAMESWDPGLKPEERRAGLLQKENDRAQLKAYAKATANAENAIKGFLNQVKESDLEAGRTLKDVHGNLVRVDQRLMRPDANTIQFFNIVKRPYYADYSFTNANAIGHGFQYNDGAVTNRLDLMQMNMAFNKALPDRIEEWPSFFGDDSIKPTYASFVMANRTDADNIFFIAEGYRYEAARDELINNEAVVGQAVTADRDVVITGVLADVGAITAKEGLARISRLEIADNGSGSLKYTDGGATVGGGAGTSVVWALRTTGAGYEKTSEDLGGTQLWQYSATPYLIGATGAKLWVAKENYAIGNGGEIKNTADFTESSSDPFTLLKSVAGESIMYVKLDNPGGNSITPGSQISHTDHFYAITQANIDLVFIPDLMVAAVQRMLPALTELGN